MAMCISMSISVLSADYCIKVAEYPLVDGYVSADRLTVTTILSDIPAPSYLDTMDLVSLCTGSFKQKKMAQMLLPLTQSRYPDAKIVDNNNYKKYKGVFDFAFIEDKKVSKIIQDVAKVTEFIPQERYYFGIEIIEFSPNETLHNEKEIQKILNTIPLSERVYQDHKLILRSGTFENESDAEVVLSLIQQHYPSARLVRYLSKSQTIQEPKSLHVKQIPDLKKRALSSEKKYRFIDDTSIPSQGFIDKSLISKKRNIDLDTSHNRHVKSGMLEKKDESFNGLYLKTNTAWDTLNNDAAYDIRLEWDIYDQGYFHAQQNEKKDELDKTIAMYRTLNQVNALSKTDVMRKIDNYINAVISHHNIEKLKLQEGYLTVEKERYNARMITQFSYDMFIFELEKTKETLSQYRYLTLLKIPQKLWELLNQIEYVKLKEDRELLEDLSHNSTDKDFYEALAKKEDFRTKWSDKLRLNLYVGQRKMYVSQNQTIVGVDAKIPIASYDDNSVQIQRIQTQLLQEESKLLERQKRDQLNRFMAHFHYSQNHLKRQKEQLKRIATHLDSLQNIRDLGYGDLIEQSIEQERKLALDFHDKRLQIQLARFESYKTLIEILFLSKNSKLSDLLEYALPDYVDHREGRSAH